MSIYICGGSDLHPYECSHDEHCIHCTWGKFGGHDPDKCALCQYMGRLSDKDYQHPIRVKDYSHRKLNIKVLAKQPQERLPF